MGEGCLDGMSERACARKGWFVFAAMLLDKYVVPVVVGALCFHISDSTAVLRDKRVMSRARGGRGGGGK